MVMGNITTASQSDLKNADQNGGQMSEPEPKRGLILIRVFVTRLPPFPCPGTRGRRPEHWENSPLVRQTTAMLL